MQPSRLRHLLVGLLACAAIPGFPGGAAAEHLADVPADPVQVAWVEVFADLPSPEVMSPELLVLPLAKQADTDRSSAPVAQPEPRPRGLLASLGLTGRGSDYRVEDNQQVRRYIEQYRSGDRAAVEGWLGRAGQYLPMVVDIFRQRGLPEELVFTAMIESGFNPVAVSRAGAKGLWQFMAPTARRYGLRVDDWLDERLDPEKSTIAAARHFLDLYATFGSWNLAKAAYNAGEYRVLSAMKSVGTRDFWKLASGNLLKEETKNFVPAIHAAATIAREPERFGLAVTLQEPVQYDRVTVPGGMGLGRLAQLGGVPLADLERLNPELTMKQTPPGGSHELKVPPGMGIMIEQGLADEAARRSRAAAAARGEIAGGDVHVVQPGDSVSTIARRYGVTVADIRRWNALPDVSRISPGRRLLVGAGPARETVPGQR